MKSAWVDVVETAFMRATVVVAFSMILISGCTQIFNLDPPPLRGSIAVSRPLDILFVVDNSPSMGDEQARLRRAIYDPACPIEDVRDVPQRFLNPSDDTFAVLTEVCGVAQLLAAVGSDFHLGVITTDVGVCDERISALDPENLHTPTTMRGCLQGPGVMTRDDDVGIAFENAIKDVGLYGSPFERAFDAVEIFLTEGSRRAPGCEGDLEGFLRPGGRLMVVFVGDEDDCSHRDGAFGFPNELEGEPPGCGDFQELFTASSQLCRDDPSLLMPTTELAAVFNRMIAEGRTSDILVGVLGGVVTNARGQLVAGGCRGTAEGIDSVCASAYGRDQTCTTDDRCCTAEAATRYVRLAERVNDNVLLGSVCDDDYRRTLLPIFDIPAGDNDDDADLEVVASN